MTKALTIAMAIACYASFYWAIRCFFTERDSARPGMRWIARLGAVFTLLHLAALVRYADELPWAAAGLAMYAGALALFWWTIRTNRRRPLSLAFSPDSPQHLVSDGPYAWVRHPFYSAYSLAWLAGAVATACPWLLVTVAIMLGLYARAAGIEEGKFAASELSVEYARYRERTGRFFPKLL